MSQRRKDLIAVLLLGVVVLLAFADVLVLGKGFFVRDHFRFHFPTKAIVREVVLDGEFPHWNRYYAGGQPLAANPEFELFYPPHWIILLPDYYLGYRLQVVLHFLIAGIGMFVLGRVLGAGTRAAFITAVTFSLCGPMLSETSRLGTFLSISWWPWISAGTMRYLSTGSRRAFAGSAAAFGLQALVGEPYAIAMSLVLMIGIALYGGARHGTAGAVRSSIARIAAIAVFGLLIGAAQLVPSFDLLRDSVRSADFSFQEVSTWSFPPERAAELLLPRFLGRFWVGSEEVYWGDRLYPEKTLPFIFSIYLGLLAPVLFVAAVARGVPKFRGAALFCVAIVPLLLGRNTPLLEGLYNAGILTNFRFTERFAFFLGFIVLALSAVALEQLLAGDRELRRNVLVLLVLAMLAALSAAALAEPARFASFFEVPRLDHRVVGAAAFRSDSLVAAFKCAVLAGLVAFAGRNVRIGTLMLAAFVIIDLAPLNKSIAPRISRDFFAEPPIAAQLREKLAGARLFPQAMHFPTPPLPNQFLVGHGRMWSARNALTPMTPGMYGVEMALDADISATWLKPTRELLLSAWDLRNAGRSDWSAVMMAFSDARYRTLYRDPSSIPADADPREFSPVAFVEGRPVERFYFADRIVRARNRSEFVKELLTIENPWKHAFVDIAPFTPAPGRVLSSKQTHNRVELEVDSEGRGYLVVSITAHKYWTARLDGAPVELRTTNLGYQGLEVPAGRHRVTMQYRNVLVMPSVIVSATTAIAVAALFLLTLRRGRREGDATESVDGKGAQL